VRCFLAIPSPDNVNSSLESPRDELDSTTDLRPVDTSHFHLTVKFLGDTTRGKIQSLAREFRSRLPTTGPLTLKIRRVGVFPNVKSASVAWAGIESTEPLERLHDSVETIATEYGFDPEDHEFTPHITLGRFNNDPDPETVLDWVKKYDDTEFGRFEAEHLQLFESELTSDGPNYNEWVRWPL
jgi:2'-5' RNA ligase